MVRYARAKGSKASNERVPEQATPWHEMKQQMVNSQKKVEPIKDVRALLKEDNDDVGSTWAKFEETKPIKIVKGKKSPFSSGTGQKKRKMSQNIASEHDESQDKIDVNTSFSFQETNVSKHKKKKKDFEKNKTDSDFQGTRDLHVHVSQNLKDDQFETKGDWAVEDMNGKRGFMNRHQKQKASHPVPKRQQFADNKKGTFKFAIGSREIELRYYGGFPVKVEDWERLAELRRKLNAKKIPEEQIKATMKLERRRAEKALAREKKKVCFHCREPGHMLSECPSVGESPFGKSQDSMPDAPTTGLCFKCGSLEHTYLECKVVQDNAFKFAKCFVCGEQGHISRQCPDNPRGLYPKGGGCAECGAVTHFRKDCPKYQNEKEDTAITLPVLRKDDALEALDNESIKPTPKVHKTPKKKVVQF